MIRFKQLEIERRETRQENLIKQQIGLLEQVMCRLDTFDNRRSATREDVNESEKSIASSETTAG